MRFNFLLWKDFLRDITIIKVNSLMAVFHFQVTTDSWNCHDLLIFILIALIDFVAVVHWDRCDILESRLETATHHYILLDKFYIAFFLIFCQFLLL